MAGAMDHIIKAAISNFLANLPPDTLAQIHQIGDFIATLDAKISRIEMQQRAIMDALQIGTEQETDDDGRNEGRDGERRSAERKHGIPS